MKTTIIIKGMTCSHCELLIDTTLLSINGVTSSESNYIKGEVAFEYEQTLVDKNAIIASIESLGYQAISDKHALVSSKALTFIFILLLLLVGYFILRFSYLLSFDFIPSVRQSMGYGSLFFIGILSSLHCVAMCGSICMSQSSKTITQKNISKKTMHPSLLYNLGRLTSYTIIGAIIGGIGSILSFNGQLKGYITLFISLIMLLMALKMIRLYPNFLPNTFRFRNVQRKHFLKLQHFLNRHTAKSPFFVGLANGFMPCGPLQSIQLYALGTGSVIEGALSMFYFSLGTFPLMFGIGFISNLLQNHVSKSLHRLSGLLIFVLALTMFSRGAALAGIVLPMEYTGTIVKSALVEENLQEVRITLSSNKYPSIQVQEDIPVKLIIEVDEKNLNGCNNPLTLPTYQLEKTLVPGENILYFTPTESGKSLYTCWMGMIRGTIEVVPK